MGRNLGILVGLLVSLLAGGLRADEVAAPRQAFAVSAVTVDGAGGPVILLLADEVLSAPLAGRYAVVDITGLVGEAGLLPDRTRRGGGALSPVNPPWHAELQWLAAPRRPPGPSRHLVAFGPLPRAGAGTYRGARLLRAGLARAGGLASDPDEAAGAVGPRGLATYAVDLDGDGVADLVLHRQRRNLPPVRQHQLAYEQGGETWLRRTGGAPWQKLESLTWHGQTLIGP